MQECALNLEEVSNIQSKELLDRNTSRANYK